MRIHKHIVIHTKEEQENIKLRLLNEINSRLSILLKQIRKDVESLSDKNLYYNYEINFLKIDKNILEIFKKINFEFDDNFLIQEIDLGYLVYFLDYLNYHSVTFHLNNRKDNDFFTIENFYGFCEANGYFEYLNEDVNKILDSNYFILSQMKEIDQFKVINELKNSYNNIYDEVCNYFIYTIFLYRINNIEVTANDKKIQNSSNPDSKLTAKEWGILGRLVIEQFYNKRKPKQWEMALAIHCITGYSQEKLKKEHITGQNKIDDLTKESKNNLTTLIKSLYDEIN
ncbi:hypothetical protein AS589_03220 [Empedobacter brevis]|uniref:hypothetical protein n=1 Tax=Empedobacter brevis TaxID=247 RepID=UPI0013202CFC|nr:hypothetical protein [Empedobacter brevis]QHC83870.1 hypothetical protein AS589_03220 [Empedobacter brevis]